MEKAESHHQTAGDCMPLSDTSNIKFSHSTKAEKFEMGKLETLEEIDRELAVPIDSLLCSRSKLDVFP